MSACAAEPRGRGRPARVMLQQHAALLPHISGSADGTALNIPNSSGNKQVDLVQLACGRHGKLRQLLSATRSAQRAGTEAEPTLLYCKMCNMPEGLDKVQKASQWEQHLYALLARSDWCHGQPAQWFQETRVLGGFTAGVWVPELGLAINVDGSHHFPNKNAGMHAHPSAQQAQRDERLNCMVVDGKGRRVRGLVRLHYADAAVAGAWLRKLKEAVQLLRAGSRTPFVLFTAGYKREDMTGSP
jgi:hypothetical protein